MEATKAGHSLRAADRWLVGNISPTEGQRHSLRSAEDLATLLGGQDIQGSPSKVGGQASFLQGLARFTSLPWHEEGRKGGPHLPCMFVLSVTCSDLGIGQAGDLGGPT